LEEAESGRFPAQTKNRDQSPFPRVKSVSQPWFGLPFDEFLDRSGDLVPEDGAHRRFRGLAAERFQRGGIDVVERLGDVFVRVFVDVPLLREIPPKLPVYVLDAGLLVADVGVAEVDRGPLFPGFGGEFDRLEVGEAGIVVREDEWEHLGEGVRPDRGLEVVEEGCDGLSVPFGEPLSDRVMQLGDHKDEDRRFGGDHGSEEVHLRPVKPGVRPPHRDVVEVFPPLLADVGGAFVIVFLLGPLLVFDRLRQIGPLRRHLARGDPGVQRALRRDPHHGSQPR
jgi:hypothetical protein